MIVFPKRDWQTISEHIEAIVSTESKEQEWLDASMRWLQELATTLGAQYEITESEKFVLLSPESNRFSELLLKFSEKTLKRILKALETVAHDAAYRKNVIITFYTGELYYSYVRSHYPDVDNIPTSGFYMNLDFGHFVFPKQDLTVTEPTLANELTRACLHHLPLPVWLEEGLASTFENETTGYSALPMDKEMLQQHRQYWGVENIDEFWSGDSFCRPDDGSRLSRELAQILVRMILSTSERDNFKGFVLNAHYKDAGQRSALDNLGIGLGDLVSSYLGK